MSHPENQRNTAGMKLQFNSPLRCREGHRRCEKNLLHSEFSSEISVRRIDDHSNKHPQIDVARALVEDGR